MCKSKIHRATVSDTNINYEGSITIDVRLMELAGIQEFEQVHVVNVNNGSRFETYVMKGKKGDIILNGAAARLAVRGDKVIIIAYGYMKMNKAKGHIPRIVLVNEQNEPITKK
jgi:aspartate 1-decarboxylase